MDGVVPKLRAMTVALVVLVVAVTYYHLMTRLWIGLNGPRSSYGFPIPYASRVGCFGPPIDTSSGLPIENELAFVIDGLIGVLTCYIAGRIVWKVSAKRREQPESAYSSKNRHRQRPSEERLTREPAS